MSIHHHGKREAKPLQAGRDLIDHGRIRVGDAQAAVAIVAALSVEDSGQEPLAPFQ
jgi:hypothetical protein